MSKQRLRTIAVLAALSAFAQPSAAWQEHSIGGGAEKPAAAPSLEMPGLNLDAPDLTTGKDKGTEVRISGIGTIGVLPKLELGLELLYGGDEPNGRPEDKSQPSDVQIRATLKHRF